MLLLRLNLTQNSSFLGRFKCAVFLVIRSPVWRYANWATDEWATKLNPNLTQILTLTMSIFSRPVDCLLWRVTPRWSHANYSLWDLLFWATLYFFDVRSQDFHSTSVHFRVSEWVSVCVSVPTVYCISVTFAWLIGKQRPVWALQL